MNLHEYQAKQLLETFHVAIPQGICFDASLTDTQKNLPEIFKTRAKVAVKAQIHAGGRGKGAFIENQRAGVQIVPTDQAMDAVNSMLNNTLVTKQTGPQGKIVRKVYVTEVMVPAKEFYVSLCIDRKHQCPVLIASQHGGGEIEEVAKTHPESILTLPIDILVGLRPFQARKVAHLFGLTGTAFNECVQLLLNLYKAFTTLEASLIEINPLALTQDQHIVALDAKIQLDDNALFRHPGYAALDDFSEKDPKEVEAAHAKLNYIALQGNIACLVNGAGLAMATMDIIQHFGAHPANFLDVGGNAKQEQVEAAFRIILSDPNVQGIFINIFGGIVRCDMLAQGIINAAKSVKLTLPLVVRMKGNCVEQARKLLNESSLPMTFVEDLVEATQTIIQQVKATL